MNAKWALGELCCGAILLAAGSGCDVGGCDIDNTGFYEFTNNSTVNLDLYIDGEKIATISPGNVEQENIAAGVDHTIEFRFQDGSQACVSEVTTVQCTSKGVSCDTPPP